MFTVQSQQKNLPLNHELNYQFQQVLISTDTLGHSSFRPYIESDLRMKSLNIVMVDSGLYYYELTQKLFKEHLLEIKGEDFRLTADLLGNFRWGKDLRDDFRIMIRNTRAARVQGDIGKKVSFESFFYENLVKMPEYIFDYATSTGTLPGEGRVKVGGGKLDFGYAMGYVSFSPNKNVNVQLGHGKNFIGNGYRSMLLSDYASNYPFLRSTVYLANGKLKYTSIFAQLSSINRLPESTTPEATFKEKFGNFHYLSFKPGSKFEIGIFEGGIFKQYVDSVGTVPMHFSAYSPILGSSIAFNGFETENNVVLGLNMSYRLFRNIELYGQVAVDNPAKTKFGFQVGAKSFDSFGIKGLYLQTEMNRALPYTYSTGSGERLQNWSHMRAPLAHTYGSSFNELVGIAYYEKKKVFGQIKLVSAIINGLGEGYQYDIEFPDEVVSGDPVDPVTIYNNVQELTIGYRLNVKTNLTGFASIRNRVHAEPEGVSNSAFIYLGLRTNLNNLYYDF